MQRIGVFCGSHIGSKAVYQEAARELGRLLVQRGYGLVYGGGHVGLMGIIAEAVLQQGGEVDGVIPETMMAREGGHRYVTRMHVVSSMHERKARMIELADGFIAMPGGYGTFEELLEVITWAQLGIHHKPVGLLNVAHYYDAFVACVDYAITEGFIRAEQRQLTIIVDTPAGLLEALAMSTVVTPRTGMVSSQ
ncbi:putative cytokinin riboside 5'-monophosphate phosphoribohydrolase [Candidatus Entotheonellaceae bacterium PAL068K]